MLSTFIALCTKMDLCCFLFVFVFVWMDYALPVVIAAVAWCSIHRVAAVAATEGAVAINLLERGATEPTIRVQTDAVGQLPFAVIAGQALLQLRQVLDTIGTVTVDV